MPTVRSTVLLSLAAVAEGRVALAEDLGLLQGMHLNGMLTLDESNAKSTNLMKTAEALETLVRRVSEEKRAPDQTVKDAMEAFKATLATYHDELNKRVAAANAELEAKAGVHNACDATPFAVDISAAEASEGALNTAHGTWNTAKTDSLAKGAALATFVSGLAGAQGCDAPASHDDGVVQAYFDHLGTIVAKKPEYESKKGEADDAHTADVTAAAALNTARAEHRTAVCAARAAHHGECVAYGVCMRDAQVAHESAKSAGETLSQALLSEAQVIKKSQCYVNLLLNSNGVIDVTPCTTGAEGQLSDEEKSDLTLQAGAALDEWKPCAGLTGVVALDACAQPTALSNAFQWEACAACAALSTPSPFKITGDVIAIEAAAPAATPEAPAAAP